MGTLASLASRFLANQPSSFDLWSLEQTEFLYTEMQPANAKLKGYTFLNKADPRGTDNEEAAEMLREVQA